MKDNEIPYQLRHLILSDALIIKKYAQRIIDKEDITVRNKTVLEAALRLVNRST